MLHRKLNCLSCALLSLVLLSPTGAAETFPGEDSLLTRLQSNDIATYYELQCLMNVYQMRHYLMLPSSRARAQWVERFWMELDPTPTTDVNERRVEHEQRLSTARELFPSQKAPGWDARGEVVLRYGMPDSRTLEQGDVTPNTVIPAREIWSYRIPPIVVLFEDINLIGEFTYSVEPTLWWNVPPGPNTVPDNIDYQMPMWTYLFFPDPASGICAADVLIPLMIEENPDDYPLTTDELRAAIERTPAIYDCDRERERLPLYFDVTSFRGGDRSLRAEVHFEVPAKWVHFAPGAGGRTAEIEFRVVARDFDMKEIARASNVITPTLAGDSLPAGRLVPGQITLALKPGYYRIGLEARDRNSNRMAAFTSGVQLSSYGPALAVSDIEFASSIEENEENPAFAKGILRVVPHPMRSYRIPLPITFYFEIYGLTTDDEDLAFYKVEYRIDPLRKRRWGPVLQDVPTNISSSFETSGYGETQPQRLSIATENLWEGPFKLIVKVTDRRTGRTAAKSAKFSILE
jgi:GWxTD domain-containing protein